MLPFRQTAKFKTLARIFPWNQRNRLQAPLFLFFIQWKWLSHPKEKECFFCWKSFLKGNRLVNFTATMNCDDWNMQIPTPKQHQKSHLQFRVRTKRTKLKWWSRKSIEKSSQWSIAEKFITNAKTCIETPRFIPCNTLYKSFLCLKMGLWFIHMVLLWCVE